MHAESPDAHPEEFAPPRSERGLAHKLILTAALALLPLVLILAALVTPDERGFGTHEQFGLPPCRTVQIWGLPCPGCGVTTAIVLAARGRFADSITTQPFGFLILLAIPLIAIWAVRTHRRGRDLHGTLANLSSGIWLAGPATAMVLAWIYKILALQR